MLGHLDDYPDSDERARSRLRRAGCHGAPPRRARVLRGRRYSIADISLYAYTHVADEGGFDLSGYPAISAWLGRVAAEPGHISIDD